MDRYRTFARQAVKSILRGTLAEITMPTKTSLAFLFFDIHSSKIKSSF
jgi:hypothetical protein